MSKLWQKIRHNQGLVTAGMFALAVACWAYGCQPSVKSIIHPGLRLDRNGLVAEVEAFAAQAASRFKSLEQQEKLRQVLFSMVVKYAEGGSVNPAAVALILGNILGAGAILDNRRKDVHIKTLKTNAVGRSA